MHHAVRGFLNPDQLIIQFIHGVLAAIPTFCIEPFDSRVVASLGSR